MKFNKLRFDIVHGRYLHGKSVGGGGGRDNWVLKILL